MKLNRLYRAIACAALPLLATGCASVEPASSAKLDQAYVRPGPFPAPPALRPQVEFWKNVYSRWSLGQYALHDDEHLDLVYEVVTLPDGGGEGLTAYQKDFLRGRKAELEGALRQLEHKAATGEPLNDAEQALKAKIVASSAGEAGVRGAAERLRAQRGIRERFRRGLELGSRYDARFRALFREAGLPEDLAFLPHVESSFQASARSSVGAAGIWQFMPATARHHGMALHPATDERLDPITSARAAARYLGDANARLGDWSLAITSYNHGVGGMARAKSQFGTDFARIVRDYDHASFGFASRNFYTQFLAAREIAGDPQRYFQEPIAKLAPHEGERVGLDRPTSAFELASYYGLTSGELAALNPAWSPAALNGRALLPAGAGVWLPGGTLARLAQAGRATTPPELIAMNDTPPRPSVSVRPAPRAVAKRKVVR